MKKLKFAIEEEIQNITTSLINVSSNNLSIFETNKSKSKINKKNYILWYWVVSHVNISL